MSRLYYFHVSSPSFRRASLPLREMELGQIVHKIERKLIGSPVLKKAMAGTASISQAIDSDLFSNSLKNEMPLRFPSLSMNIARFRLLDFADGYRNPSRSGTLCS